MSGTLSEIISKFVSRLLFIVLVVVLVPLAVQNRQRVTLELNPLALINEAYSFSFSMPLFMLIVLVLFASLVSGALFGYGVARLRQRKKAATLARAVPPAPLAGSTQVATKMLEAGAEEARRIEAGATETDR